MTFRVVAGEPPPGGAKAEGNEPNQLVVHPTEGAAAQRVDFGAVTQLLERLEGLSFTFEAMNSGSRSYAAEAVMETLARMERRDLQALAAIEAFAGALKTVSHHLSGMRNTVQSTAYETAAGLDHLSDRLGRVEGRAGITGSTGYGQSLDGIAERLIRIEAKLAEPPLGSTTSPLLPDMLETIARRVSRIERKISESAAAPKAAADTPQVTVALETIARRVSRIEKKIGAHPLHETLDSIAGRVLELERRLDSGTDGKSIASLLDAIAERLSHIEAGVAPAPAAEVAAAEPPPAAPDPAATEAPPEEAAGPRRGNPLLERVFNVLSK